MIEKSRQIAPPPIHPLAAFATIALDGVFALPEFAGAVLIVSPVVGVLGGVSTALIQRFLAKDEWGVAVAKGFALGIIAGVPYPVAGTAVGLPLLAWAGISRWMKLPDRSNNQLIDEAIQRPRLTKGDEE
jgi:hypothetical protein